MSSYWSPISVAVAFEWASLGLRSRAGIALGNIRQTRTLPTDPIAAELGLSEATVKVHRGQVMRKMRAQSLAELVRMADKLAPSQTSRKPLQPKFNNLDSYC
jgi:hypothetical protein